MSDNTVGCEDCGKEAEFDRCEWERYMDSYEEEIVSVYVCECGEEISVRKRDQ
jgi:hypothetical protein